MKFNYKKYFKYIFLFTLLCGSFTVSASIISGTISSSNHTAQVCETTSCVVSGTSPVNFGYFTTTPASNVVVEDTALSGFIWGESFGWAVLNCEDTVSGCSATNGNFKVANDYNGNLSGYAWGESSGWINFGPFLNSATSPITINSSGQFAGYAWTQNHGWIKFDCASGADFCVETDWRPRNTRPECSDGADNDGDTLVDSADSGCINNSVYDPTDNVELVSGGPDGGGDSICRVPTALNFGGPKPCVFPVTICLDTAATNYGGPLPCTYPSNLCNDPSATNFGGPLPCTYPPALCLDHNANNYGGPLPCTYPQTCTGPNCAPGDDGDGGSNFCILHPLHPSCIKKSTEYISGVIKKPVMALTSKVVIATGALTGVALGLATSLFANPLTFSEIFLIPLRLWSLLMSALGLKRRNRPWGTVYDSTTKQPLDPAYVILQDLQGKEISSSITDLDGRYGFLVPAGQYRIIANKTNYEFPSKKLQGKTSDEMYQDLYFGDIITITEGEVITKNIPMDPLKFDWNEFAKKDQKLMKFYSSRDVWISRIANILFYLGFSITILAVLVTPEIYNIITLAVYLLIFILKRTLLKPRPFGRLTYRETGAPLPFAILHVFSVGTDHEVAKKVSDRNGKYYCLIPNGAYYVKIESKNIDGTYSPVYTSSPFEVENGFIRKKFEI